MEVEVLDEVFPATPIVIGRLRGGEPGPSVVLNGHLDTVPIPHEPARVEDGAVYGRGSADMKGALACAAETARVLKQAGAVPGRARDRRDRHARGTRRARRGPDLAPARARLPLRPRRRLRAERRHVRRRAHGSGDGRDHDRAPGDGHARAEDGAGDAAPDPRGGQGDRGRSRRATTSSPPSSTRGSGRRPTSSARCTAATSTTASRPRCRLVGTRRWAPGNTLAAVEAEFEQLLAPIAAETGCSIELDLRLVRGAYSIDPEHPLSRALRAALRGRHRRRSCR